jgi:hypothetical protein
MDRRTANRLNEHSKDGHQLRDATDDIQRVNIDTTTQRLHKCLCGWLGWLKVASFGS